MTITDLINNYLVLAGAKNYIVAWDMENLFAIFYEYAPDEWHIVRLYHYPYTIVTGQAARNVANVCLSRYLSDVDGSYSDGAELQVTLPR